MNICLVCLLKPEWNCDFCEKRICRDHMSYIPDSDARRGDDYTVCSSCSAKYEEQEYLERQEWEYR